MTTTSERNLDRVASWMVVTLLPISVAVAGWAMLQIIDNDRRLAVLEADREEGPRFTFYDFQVAERVIHDHETRIRFLESVR